MGKVPAALKPHLFKKGGGRAGPKKAAPKGGKKA